MQGRVKSTEISGVLGYCPFGKKKKNKFQYGKHSMISVTYQTTSVLWAVDDTDIQRLKNFHLLKLRTDFRGRIDHEQLEGRA